MISMKMRIWIILACAFMVSAVSGCRSNRPSGYPYPDYSSRYTRQAREYEQAYEKTIREEEARLQREEEARIAQEQQTKREQEKAAKRLAEEQEAREKEARKLAEKQARADEAARKKAAQPRAMVPVASPQTAPSPASSPIRPHTQRPPVASPVPVKVDPQPEQPRIPAAVAPAPRAEESREYGNTGRTSPYQLKSGDVLAIYLRGIPREEEIQDVIDERGYVTLTYINEVLAAGKTTSELERAIRDAYLKAEIYKTISVNVVMQQQSYYVRGEVRLPGRYALLSGMTLVQAIATAGGYTEFAQPKKVKLIRGDNSNIYDVKYIEKNPEKDIAIEAEDVIVVPRSVF